MTQAKDGYTVGKWHDKDNFECSDCSFATLNEGEMTKHRQKRHRRPSTKKRMAASIIGPKGEKITERERTPSEMAAEEARLAAENAQGHGPERATTPKGSGSKPGA